MKLSDLIKRIGDDYVVLQNVLHSSPDIRDGKKEGRIAFSTDKTKAQDLMHQAAMGKRGRWTALIVWLPNDRIDRLDGAEQAGGQASDDSQASPHNSSISRESP